MPDLTHCVFTKFTLIFFCGVTLHQQMMLKFFLHKLVAMSFLGSINSVGQKRRAFVDYLMGPTLWGLWLLPQCHLGVGYRDRLKLHFNSVGRKRKNTPQWHNTYKVWHQGNSFIKYFPADRTGVNHSRTCCPVISTPWSPWKGERWSCWSALSGPPQEGWWWQETL